MIVLYTYLGYDSQYIVIQQITCMYPICVMVNFTPRPTTRSLQSNNANEDNFSHERN